MQRIFLSVTLYVLALSAGYLHGRLLTIPSADLLLQADSRAVVPVVSIEGIRNGMLYGSILGEARVNIAGQILTSSGAFVADANTLLKNEVWVHVPAGVQFVASKRGKKYYPVDSAGGSRISPINRVYFSTEQEAESAGYTK